MFLSDIMNAPFALDQDPNDPSFDFDAIKPPVFNSNRKLVYNFKEFKLDSSTNSVMPTILTAESPTLTVPATVNENQTITCSFTVSSGEDITIMADKGTISNIDTVSNTFIYTAYDITDNLNGTDTISAYCTKPGALQSPTTKVQITVVYVPMAADGTISNPDFKYNMYKNNGFEF